MDNLEFIVIDDDEGDCRAITRFLSRIFHKSNICSSLGDGAIVDQVAREPHVALVDYGLPGDNGIIRMEQLRISWPSTAFIIMTGQGDQEIARDSIKRGAIDYIQKNKISESSLERMVNSALAYAQIKMRMEDQQRELEIFSDVLIHDFKSPIRSINFLVDELKIGLEENDKASTDNVMRLLKRSASRMGTLMDSLGCHVSATREVTFEPASAFGIAEAAKEAIASVIAESSADIRLEFEDFELLCCAPQLSQLFQNLFSNSIKYSGENTPLVTVTASRDEPGKVTFQITDNGIGIPQEFRERAFEPFKRAPGATSVPGTGLGLATCRKVATRHGGKIWCDAESTDGTTIFLRLSIGEI